MSMTIIVDSNEAMQTPTVVTDLQKEFVGIPVIVSKLNYGDMLIITDEGKTIAIERKAPGDLLGSIGDGRVFAQAERMLTNTPYSFILIHGAINYNFDDYVMIHNKVTQWRGKAVRAALMAVQLSGCVVIQTEHVGLGNSVREIFELCIKPSAHEQKASKVRSVTFPPCDGRVDILSQFDGVGHKRATAILEFVGKDGEMGTLADAISWGTIMDMIVTDSHPDGWGKGTVDKFRKSLGLKSNEFVNVVEEAIDEMPGD